MPSSQPSYESEQWTQKDVLLMLQELQHQNTPQHPTAIASSASVATLQRTDSSDNFSKSSKKYIFLPSANWSGLDLRGLSLKHANLRYANLSRANLSHTDLENANLRHADLSYANLSNCKLVSTDLGEANCEGTIFEGATGLGDRFIEKWALQGKKAQRTESRPSFSQKSEKNMAQLTPEQIKAEWQKADKDGDGSLSLKEIERLLGKLNMKMKSSVIKKKFQEVDADGSGELDYEEFTLFLERLRVRPEMDDVFGKYLAKIKSKKPFLTAEEVVVFCKDVQKEAVDLEAAKKIIATFEKKIGDKEAVELHSTGFSAWMNSDVNSILAPEKRDKVYQDMSQPFAHYWIASSHNTYLLGDQLKGESSVEAYINAFSKSCRCVELDCWDGPDIKQPIIYHGHTLTSKITFKEVLETIRDYGFKTTEYPVILSLEVHCGLEGQQAMAALLQEVLGAADMLPPACEAEGVLPPPDKLKRKVLLKGKTAVFEEEEDPEDAMPEEAKVKGEKGKKGKEAKEEKKEPPKVAEELSKLIHLKAVHFKSVADSKKNGKPWEMSSFGETKINKMLKNPVELGDYNTRQLSRIYPKGMRIDSSNYDPVPSWNVGAQIVALNYQTNTDPCWLNHGKFADNGGSGYLLKPKPLREKDVTFNPLAKAKPVKTLVLQVISGFQLPKAEGKETKETGEVIDPYVKVSVHGSPLDQKEAKTKVIKSNGFNPVWNAEFKFPLVHPDLALILFKVRDADFISSNDLIGQFSMPVPSMREGYHSLQLKDKNGVVYEKATIFLHVRWA